MSNLLDWAWGALVALIGAVWTLHNRRIDALERAMSEGDRANANEIDRQRDNIAKLFDKLEEHGQRSEARHIELLNALHAGLSSKADK